MYKRNAQGWSKHIDFMLLDEFSLLAAYILASLIRHHEMPYERSIYTNLGIVLMLVDLVVIMLMNSMHNVLKRNWLREASRTAEHCLLVFMFATVYMFVSQNGSQYSRLLLFYTLALHIVIGYITRQTWKWIVLHHGIPGGKKVSMLVILQPDSADVMMERLFDNQVEGYQLVGVVLEEDNGRKDVCGIPVVATIDKASEYICQEWIDSVFIDCPSSNPKVAKIMEDCHQMAVPVHYHIPSMSVDGMKQFSEKIGGTIVLTTSINYATPIQLVMKRTLDIIGGVVGSIAALLIMMIFGPMIKLASPGPILYSQERIGMNGKHFRILKLRSMYVDADRRKQELMEQNRVKDGMMFKLDFDPRIIGNEILPDGTRKTGIGEFIRSTSLDEFPQFFNVLLGQMSLVGTRPPTVDEWEKYQFHHRARLACKPGITGMWQVSGRSNITDFEEVVKLDTKYITNWSFGLDLKILLKTINVVFEHKGAM